MVANEDVTELRLSRPDAILVVVGDSDYSVQDRAFELASALERFAT